MAFLEGSTNSVLNNTTYVDVVPAPSGAARRLVRAINFYNADTVAVTIIVAFDDSGTVRLLAKQVVQAGQTFLFDTLVVLDTTTRKIKAKLNSAAATTNPDVVAAWGDAT